MITRRLRCKSIGILFTAMLVISMGCAGTGSFETGRVLPDGDDQVIFGFALRDDFSSSEDEDSVAATPQRLLNPATVLGFDLDGFVLFKTGLGNSWESEFGIKTSLLTTIGSLGHAHVPGFIVGLRRKVVGTDRFASSVGIRGSIDWFLSGNYRLSHSALVAGIQVRSTTSFHWDERAVYATPYLGFRWIRDSSRDDRDESDDWSTTQESIYLLGANGGVYGLGPVAVEVGADVVPEQGDLATTILLPRLGFGIISGDDEE